ncbi:MAG: hypothetical protein ACOZEN_01855 [Thermodesulfobacteriota bacterium]
MKRIAGSVVVLGFMTAFAVAQEASAHGGAASPAAGGLPLGHLAAWVGKYPGGEVDADRQARPGRSFFEDPAVLPSLKAMLPEDALRAMLKGWPDGRVEIPVEREGDVIKASFCKPHACPLENAAVFVNIRTGGVAACWKRYDAPKDVSSAFWHAPGAPAKALDPGDDCYAEGMGLYLKYGSK